VLNANYRIGLKGFGRGTSQISSRAGGTRDLHFERRNETNNGIQPEVNMKLLLTACALLVMAAGLAMAQQQSVRVKSSGFVGIQPWSMMVLLQREEVRKDLGTSDEVASKLKSLGDDFRAARQREYQDAGINPRDISTMTTEQRRKFDEIGQKSDDEFSAKGKELLTADQNKRLRQIQLQYRLNLSGPTALLAPEIAAELKLTGDQRQALQTVRGEFVRSLLPRGGSGDREAVEANKKNQELAITKAIDVLTAEQKETLNKLKGNEFDLSSFVISVSAGPPVEPPKDERTVETGRVHPDFILELAANEGVQKDLGVTDEVARKLMSMYRRDYQTALTKALEEAGVVGIQARVQMEIRQRQKFNEIAKTVQDEFIPKLEEVLSADQFRRLWQIQAQNQFNHDGPKTFLAPELVAELKLTDEQKTQLGALSKDFVQTSPMRIDRRTGRSPPFSMEASINHGKEYKAKAIELLTAEQQDALSKLEGKEFELAPLVHKSRPIPPR
jgi:hypothetical protein